VLVLIIASAFITLALVILGYAMKTEQQIMRERIETHAATGVQPLTAVQEEMAAPFAARVVMPFLRRLSRVAGRFTSSGAMQSAEEQLEAAAHPYGLGAKEFVGLRVLSVAVFIPAGFAAVTFLHASLLLRAASLILLIFIGFIMPDYLLGRAVTERQARIRKALPDTLDLLTVSVEAGLGLDAAIQKVIEKLKNPLSDELRIALQEMRIGKMRMDALRDAAKRTRVAELTSFVAAVYQADQLGVSISNVLRVQSQSLRSQRAQRARESAAKLPVKILFPLVFFIFPALFIVTLGPGVIQTGKALGLLGGK
jgi:tight adherence protein C